MPGGYYPNPGHTITQFSTFSKRHISRQLLHFRSPLLGLRFQSLDLPLQFLPLLGNDANYHLLVLLRRPEHLVTRARPQFV